MATISPSKKKVKKIITDCEIGKDPYKKILYGGKSTVFIKISSKI